MTKSSIRMTRMLGIVLVTGLGMMLSATSVRATTFVTDSLSCPKHEVRAVWLTTLQGLDWPRRKVRAGGDPTAQQEELTAILDELQAAHINTVIFQTRIRGTMAYPSKYEPWDECFTGHLGQSPGYDPLAFAIEECHKRGMELHAWVVSIPLGKVKRQRQLGSSSILSRHGELCRSAGEDLFMMPGHPQTADYIAAICREIAENYDVDGIQLDYIRYPESIYHFSDEHLYDKNSGMSRNDWKRSNISRIVRRVSEEVRAVKPWVKLGSSPIGKYADLPRQSAGGWNCHDAVFQDPKEWLREGWQDMVFPMMYFRGNNYYPFLCDWNEGKGDRFVIPGLGIYFLDPREGNWRLNDIRQEIHATRHTGIGGVAFYRSDFLTRDCQGLLGSVKNEFFTRPALQQPMRWAADRTPPTRPTALTLTDDRMSWNPSNDNTTGVRYNLYGWYAGDEDEAYDKSQTERGDHLLAAALETTHCTLPALSKGCNTFAVRATDRYGNESEPCMLYLGRAKKGEPDSINKSRTVQADERGYIHNDRMKKDVALLLLTETSTVVRTARDLDKISVKGLHPGWYQVVVVTKKTRRTIGWTEVGCAEY